MPTSRAATPDTSKTVTTSIKWALDVSWVCLVAPLAVALVLAVIDTQSAPSISIEDGDDVLTPLAFLLQVALQTPLLLATLSLGSRTPTGAHRGSWSLASIWLFAVALMGIAQPHTALCWAPAAISWLYVAATEHKSKHQAG